MNQSDWFQLKEPSNEDLPPYQLPKKQPKLPENYELDVEALLKVLPSEQLDSNLVKYPLSNEEEQNTKCGEKSKIKILCEERGSDGKLVLNGGQPHQTQCVKMASPIPMLQGLRKAFLSMQEGEEAWFRISNEQLYSSKEIEQNVQILEQVRYYRIKMISIEEPGVALDNSSYENRLQQMDKFRVDGNNLFNRQQYEAAMNRYKKGINFLEKWPRKLDQDHVCIRSKKQYSLIYYGNICQCLIEMEQYQEAIKILSGFVEQTRNSIYEFKNYYRLLKCYLKERDWDNFKKYVQELKYVREMNEEEKSQLEELENKLPKYK